MASVRHARKGAVYKCACVVGGGGRGCEDVCQAPLSSPLSLHASVIGAWAWQGANGSSACSTCRGASTYSGPRVAATVAAYGWLT